jgi:hypothetical protein
MEMNLLNARRFNSQWSLRIVMAVITYSNLAAGGYGERLVSLPFTMVSIEFWWDLPRQEVGFAVIGLDGRGKTESLSSNLPAGQSSPKLLMCD